MNNWKHTILGPHVDLLSGYAFKSEMYSSDADHVKLLRGDNIIQGQLRWDGVQRWPSAEVIGLARYDLEAGDIVLAMDRTWVNAGLKCARVSANDLPCLLVQRVARIRGADDLDTSFLYHTLHTNHFTQYVKGVQTETAIPHISSQQIREFPLHLPPLPEQQEIAAILSTWDRAIELTERLIAAKRRRRQALMQQLLTGKLRFTLEEGSTEANGRVSERIGTVKTNQWTTKRLKEVAPLQRGFDLTKPNLRQGTVPVISSSGLWGFHDEAKVNGPGIVIGRYGTLGDVFFVEEDFWPHNTTLWVTNFCGNDPHFLKYLYRSIDISKHSGKTGVPGLNRNDLHSMRVALPPLPEQQKIAAILSSADHETELLQHRVVTLTSQKKGLMQQLLTGKIRVNVDTETVKR
ncbi:MAG: restriction endonuclease subunit S [Pirellulaceae bacterium]